MPYNYIIVFLCIASLTGLFFYILKLKPNKKTDIKELYSQGLDMMINGLQRSAYNNFKKIVELDSENIKAYLKLGQVCLRILLESRCQQPILALFSLFPSHLRDGRKLYIRRRQDPRIPRLRRRRLCPRDDLHTINLTTEDTETTERDDLSHLRVLRGMPLRLL